MLLDNDAIAKMQEVMDTTTGEPITQSPVDEASADSTPQASESVIEALTSSETSDTANDVNDNADVHTEESVTPNHRVPYKRFKSVLDARNKYKSEVNEYQTKLTHMEQQLQQLRTTPTPAVAAKEESNDSWLDDLLSDDSTPSYSTDHNDNNYKQLEDRLYQFELKQAQAELDNEIASALNQYPNVPKNLLLQAVVQKPDVNVLDVAESYNAYISSVEEQAIQRYLSENDKPAPAAAPRGRSAGSKPNQRNAGHDSKSTSTMKDAKKALLSFMKGNKQFNV